MINRLKRAFAALHPYRRPTADRPAEDMAEQTPAAPPAPPVKPTPPPCKHGRWRTVRKNIFTRTIACRSCGITREVAR